jgi:hypothetical protein
MRGIPRTARVSLCLVLAWVLLCLADRVWGMQVQVQVVQRVVVQADQAVADPLDIEEEEEVRDQPAQPAFVLSDSQFDQWVFGGNGNYRAGRSSLDTQLSLHVDEVARVCRLTALQKKKLLLAGHGDIKRFFEKVEEKRKKFDTLKTDRNKVNEIYQELLPLQQMVRSGLFSHGSFYAKTLKTVLTDEDNEKYQELVREKNRFRYRAKIELAVAQLDQSVGFRAEQRKRLIELILNETEPPERYGQYDHYLVLYQAAKIPTAELKSLFDDRQWGLLQRSLNQGRGLEQFLRTQGLLPARDDKGNAAGFLKALRQPARNGPQLPADVFAPAAGVAR